MKISTKSIFGGGEVGANFLHKHPEGEEKKRELSRIDTCAQQRVLEDAAAPQRARRALQPTRDGSCELKVGKAAVDVKALLTLIHH